MPRPFSRVKRADARPGSCLRCTRKDDLFDLGNVPSPDLGFGVAYLCSICMGELDAAREVVTKADHERRVTELGERILQLTQGLNEATARANLPITRTRTILEEFSHVVDRAARDLVRDLDAAAAGGGDLPGPAAHEGDDEPAAVPDEPAGAVGEPEREEPQPAPGNADGDPRRAILSKLGLDRAGGEAPVGVAGAGGEPAAEDGGSDGVWRLLERDGAGEAGEGDDDAPRD